MAQLLSFIIIALLLAFYFWMFWDMGNHDEFHNFTKFYWIILFIFLNVLAAGYYYFTEYKER